MDLQKLTQDIKSNVKNVIIGKDDIIDKALTCLFANGHILLEDMPGTGKTSLAKALAKSIDGEFKRVQFTPDLLPSDVTGLNTFNMQTSEFNLHKGPAFCNILLADEINRATPRTQSSLLECMEEYQVTIDGISHILDKPFLVIATQNPIDTAGTFPLPEAQMDRFLMRISLGYPNINDEINILSAYSQKSPLNELTSVCKSSDIVTAQEFISKIKVSEPICKYIIDIVNATRNHNDIKLGVSPRGAIALMHTSKSYAGVNGYDYVLPDHVKSIATSVLSHRIIVKGANLQQRKEISAQTIDDIINTIPVPIP